MNALGLCTVLVCLIGLIGNPAHASDPELLEPVLHLVHRGAAGPQVAVTLDACGGGVDQRILTALIRNGIPATVFVSARWLRRNPEAFARLRANPALFEIENHGRDHIPAVDRPLSVFDLATAGSLPAVETEVSGGAEAIVAAGGEAPRWFRGATARYSATAVAAIRRVGYRIAGYSLNGDGGASFSAGETERRIAQARDGDITLAHLNQLGRTAGAGVVAGLLRLRAAGFRFVQLSDAVEVGSAAMGSLCEALSRPRSGFARIWPGCRVPLRSTVILPSTSSAIRSQRSARLELCVTMTMVAPRSRSMRRISSKRLFADAVSRLPVGLSASTRSGSIARARAIATRCWPSNMLVDRL